VLKTLQGLMDKQLQLVLRLLRTLLRMLQVELVRDFLEPLRVLVTVLVQLSNALTNLMLEQEFEVLKLLLV